MAAELGGSFEGKVVEIRADGRPLRVAQEQEDGTWDELPEVELDGHRGLCVGLDEDLHEYTVQTFGGLLAIVPEDCLAVWIPDRSSEEGGFDLEWPGELLPHAAFGVAVSDVVKQKGFCMIQMSIEEGVLTEALSMTEKLDGFDRLREETVIDYMGRDNATTMSQVPDDVPDEEPDGALGLCDRFLSNLGLLLEPEAQDAFGYELIGRTNGFVRQPCASKAEAAALAPPYSDEEVTSGRVEGFFQWIQSRKLCVFLMLAGDGSEITLHPKPGHGEDIKLSIPENRLLIFRHDDMSYTFRPAANSSALQAWLLTGLPSVELRSMGGQQKDYADNLGLTGPWQPEGEQALVKSLMVRMPGRSWGYYNYWNMFTAGCDCVLEWSNTRWETELYYEEDRDTAMMMGKSYMHHGGFLDETEFTCFDNSFFGMTEAEAMCIYPGQRIVLEVGYESLFRAGYTRSQAAGERIAVQIGDVGPDWHSVDTVWPHMVEGDFTEKREGVNAGVTCTRLSHFLNLIGPTNSVATACSSSLVALNIAHHNMANVRDEPERTHTKREVYERALIVGINTLMAPFSFMGQCSMGGTTFKGRSFTFDTGADGYQRGEGCSATFIQMHTGEEKNADRLACVIGSAVNQDGRSASLTAPNGPSQAALLKQAMKMAQLSPVEVTAAECHGTGTALGDPIEIGALQNVLSNRDRAILKTSAKSNMAHLEASAGMAGFAKCIMMILASATPPNLHLKILNPHLTVEGYPVHFTTEITPWGQNSGYCGVSSFGIGGTNARGEILGRCQRGPQETGRTLNDLKNECVDFVTTACPRCEGKMLFPSGSAVPQPLLQLPPSSGQAPDASPVPGVLRAGKHRSTLIRDEFADYSLCSDCYQDLTQGEFRCGSELQGVRNPNAAIFIRGTWDGFAILDEMSDAGSGSYTYALILGETRCERFQIVVERSRNHLIYPVKDDGHQRLRILGPDDQGLDKYWMIDARESDVPAGAVYLITFLWEGDRKRISWRTLTEDIPSQVAGMGFRHRYALLGSWTSFKPVEMISDSADGGVFESTFKIGPYGLEEFQVIRDMDEQQVIYPASLTVEAVSLYKDDKTRRVSGGSALPSHPKRFVGRQTPWNVPVRGPDQFSKDKRFAVQGKEGESVSIRLSVVDGHISLGVASKSVGRRSWESRDGLARKMYYITGSFNDWELSPMEPDDTDLGAFTFQLELPFEGAEFHLVIDADPTQRLYPQLDGATSGESLLEGPDKGPDGRRCWQARGPAGSLVDVRLNLRAEDRRQVLTWKPAALALDG